MKEQDLKLKIAELKDTIVFLRKELELIKNKNKMENKETLEEAAEKYAKTAEGIDIPYQNGLYYGFVEGAKWQAERMYSEEYMIEFAEWIANSKLHGYSKQLYEAMIIYKVKTTKDLLKVWFEQFKKK